MDLDAYELVLDLLAQSHAYGESIADKIELWIGTSFGLIVMAYFAPDRLKLGIASLVVAIYVAFTVWVFSNIGADVDLSDAALNDARALAQRFEIESDALSYRVTDGGHGCGIAVAVFMVGLFTSTIGYVGYTALETFRRGRRPRA